MDLGKKYQYKTGKYDPVYVIIFSQVSKLKCLKHSLSQVLPQSTRNYIPIIMENSKHMSRIRQSNAERKVKVNNPMF